VSLSEDQARALIGKVLELSKADECFVTISESDRGNLRYAHNEVTTSGETSNLVVRVTSSFGKRSGTASVNQTDSSSLERTVRHSEETARFAPEDPERMPMLEGQRYAKIEGYDEAAAATPPSYRAGIAGKAIGLAKEKNVMAAGFFTNAGEATAIGNSRGLFGFRRQSLVTYSTTARTPDGTGSGWAGSNSERLEGFDPISLSRTAVEKAVRSRNPRPLTPGKYAVILEPAAVADLLSYLSFSFDARMADEGRSFFAAKDGKTKLGQRVVAERVSLWTDPADPRVPGSPFTSEGLPTRRVSWIENGVVSNLSYSRYWAQKQNKEPVPSPINLIMKGGEGSLADLIRGTNKGVLVTRLWYIRFLNPQSILLTGLTRDGLFYIENGKIRYPVKNFRWNDSPVSILSSIEAMSREVRARGSESEDFPIICPAIRTKMEFSSLSDAV